MQTKVISMSKKTIFPSHFRITLAFYTVSNLFYRCLAFITMSVKLEQIHSTWTKFTGYRPNVVKSKIWPNPYRTQMFSGHQIYCLPFCTCINLLCWAMLKLLYMQKMSNLIFSINLLPNLCPAVLNPQITAQLPSDACCPRSW